MPEVKRSVIVPFSPSQMFALVDDVEHYPAFLPWCGGAQLLFRDEHTTRATLTIDYLGLRHSFTTENDKQPPLHMLLKFVEGPFQKLDGEWRFTDLAGQGCKVEFRIEYEFSTPVVGALLGPLFAHIAGTFVDAFVLRARRIYPAGAPRGAES